MFSFGSRYTIKRNILDYTKFLSKIDVPVLKNIVAESRKAQVIKDLNKQMYNGYQNRWKNMSLTGMNFTNRLEINNNELVELKRLILYSDMMDPINFNKLSKANNVNSQNLFDWSTYQE